MLNLLDLGEAARELKVSIFTMRSWTQKRKIPTVKLGRRVLVKQEELERFVEANIRKAAV
jgi:excisionase family DNA binding protein